MLDYSVWHSYMCGALMNLRGSDTCENLWSRSHQQLVRKQI